MKLNPTYLKWTIRNPLVPISIPVPLLKILKTHIAPLISFLRSRNLSSVAFFLENLKLANVK